MNDRDNLREALGVFGTAIGGVLLAVWCGSVLVPAAETPARLVATLILLSLAITGMGLIMMIGANIAADTETDTETETPSPGTPATELVEEMREYPRVGEYMLTRITHVYSPTTGGEFESDYGLGSYTETEKIKVAVDTPRGTKTWTWEFPLSWTEDDSNFVSLVHNYDLSRSNFHELEGKPVLAKFVDGTRTLNLTHPEEEIAGWIEDGDIEWNEVEMGAIQEHFDLDLEVNGTSVDADSGIVVEDLPDDFITEE